MENVAINQRVMVIGTDLIGKVIRIGGRGMVLLDLLTEHSGFDRTVYHVSELMLV